MLTGIYEDILPKSRELATAAKKFKDERAKFDMTVYNAYRAQRVESRYLITFLPISQVEACDRAYIKQMYDASDLLAHKSYDLYEMYENLGLLFTLFDAKYREEIEHTLSPSNVPQITAKESSPHKRQLNIFLDQWCILAKSIFAEYSNLITVFVFLVFIN